MMFRRSGERFWDYYEGSDTIHGPIKLRVSYPNHVMQTDSVDGKQYLHPKEQITDFKLYKNSESVRIRTRDGRALSAELSSHIPIGQMMFRHPGDRFWDYYEGSDTVIGPTKLRADSPSHVMQTDSLNGLQYLHPIEQIADSKLHESVESVSIRASGGRVQSSILFFLARHPWG